MQDKHTDVGRSNAMSTAIADVRARRRRFILPLIVGITVFVMQLSGQYGAGLGYALLLASVILLLGAVAALALLVLTGMFSTEYLSGAMRWLFSVGAWVYVIGVFDLSGHYLLESLQGRVELKWMLFGPLALLTLIVFDIGLYRLIYRKNHVNWKRYRQHINRKNAQPQLMRAVLYSDVLMHTSLLSVSGLRWLRHTLIFWGFVLMFAVEVAAVFVREGIPAFGFVDIWEMAGHPVRLAFDFAFDFFGLMVLIGCLLSFVWRISARGSEVVKFADTPSAVFLFLVVLSGFVVEAARIASGADLTGSAYSFVGWTMAYVAGDSSGWADAVYTPMWYLHVFGSLAFIVYIPAFRLVHSCATPVGRLMNSQKRMLANKRDSSIAGLMPGMDKQHFRS